MKKRVELSIIIVSFNTYNFLRNCLFSIYKSDLNPKVWEIIIVDNASSDKTIKKLKKEFPKVKIVSNQVNIGFAAANNQGLKIAKGEYILFLNPDTLLEKNTLKIMLGKMKIDNKIGAGTVRVNLSSGEIDDACHRGFPTPWNAFCYFSGLGKLFPKSLLFNGYHLGYKDIEKFHEIDSCAGAFMMVRRKAGEEIGWFDEDYFWYGEDLDFCYRLKEKGWKIVFIPLAKIIHYKGVASGIKEHSQSISSATYETKEKAMRARFSVMRIFYQKHYQDKYPYWLNFLIMNGINLKEFFSIFRLLHRGN